MPQGVLAAIYMDAILLTLPLFLVLGGDQMEYQ